MAAQDLPFLPPKVLSAGGSNSAAIRLLQITDCHLGEREGEKLVGMDTDASLDLVIDMMLEQQFSGGSNRPSAVIATGDLANHGAPSAYRRLQQKLAAFPVPCVWLPGNHDDVATMRDVTEVTGELARSLTIGNWHLLMLDSTVPRQVGGFLGDQELRNFVTALTDLPSDTHIAIAVHHQPVAVGCEWLDQQRIADGEKLLSIIEADKRVKAIFWGHVHQDYTAQLPARDDVMLFATPSSCAQFLPGSKDFALDKAMPGYRWIDLFPDGRVESGVSRLTNVSLEFDLQSSGY